MNLLQNFAQRSPSVASRLYLAGIVAGLAVLVMTAMAVYYAERTSRSAKLFSEHALGGVVKAAELGLILARHTSLIERAGADFEGAENQADKLASTAILRQMRELVQASEDPGIRQISTLLPGLEEAATQVLTHLAAYSPERLQQAQGTYSFRARQVQLSIAASSEVRMKEARDVAAGMIDASRLLSGVVILTAFGIIALLLPIGLQMVAGIATRLQGLTDAMLALARNETNISIPSTNEVDEIGDMARAVQVFKANALVLLEQKNELQVLNERFNIALNNMARGLTMFDKDGRLLVCNRAYAEIYGLPQEMTRPGTSLDEILRFFAEREAKADGKDHWDKALAWRDGFLERIREGGTSAITKRLPDGRVISVRYQALPDGGWVDTHTDVTKERRAEQKIARQARQDMLTEVGNRFSFREQLKRAFDKLENGGSGFAVHWIDLDRFKEINDSLGHPAGDALLISVAQRLSRTVRGTDFVARLGGDEFAIIQSSAHDEQRVLSLASRLQSVLAQPYEIAGKSISSGASIGVSLAPQHGASPDELLKNADIALYRAKSQGRGSVVVFHPEHEQEISERRRLENDLREALGLGQIELYYQPIINLVTGRVTSCEALMRWRHPERGFVSPAQFIPVAEEIGLIIELGSWAIREACRNVATWPEQTRVAVNLSALQITQGDVCQVVAEALAENNLAAHRLELEVTETLMLQDGERTLEVMLKLREIGVAIALDDFGTGFSSLSYLRRFPFDSIKIDQTFVRDLPHRGDCAAIVGAVSGLARMLNMSTVAEGIETAEHLRLVRQAGCRRAQGYFFSRPVPATQIIMAMAETEQRLAAVGAVDDVVPAEAVAAKPLQCRSCTKPLAEACPTAPDGVCALSAACAA